MINTPIIVAPRIFIKGRDGFALPFCIVIRERRDSLIKHELCHVRQWWRYGVIGFPFVYGHYLLKSGYKNHPLEIEARRAEND